MPAAHRLRKVLVAALLLTSLTLVSAPSASAAVGDIDSALNLSGTQNAQVSDPGSSPFDISGNLSLEAWVYPTTACPSDQAVVGKDYAYMLYCTSGYWGYAFSSNGTSWTGMQTGIPVVANTWAHLAITHGAGVAQAKYYFNGVNVETVTTNVPATIALNNTNFRIGTIAGGSFFQGKVDEIRVWNSVRTDSQVAGDMSAYANTSDSNLIAYYDFNDDSGSSIPNAVSNPAANSTLTTYFSPTFVNVESTSVINGDQVITFPRSYLTANGGWKIPSNVSVAKTLVIAGGGAGGSRAGGGGGAGGYVYNAAYSVTPNSNQSIVVGAGGVGYIGRQGTNGQNSSLASSINALGGGGGGSAGGVGNSLRVGLNGGSGGGASGDYSIAGSSAAFGYGQQNSTYGYGSGANGGSGYDGGGWAAGGGGGANLTTGAGGSSTSNGTVAGKGGNGITDPIGGTTTCYATGGGGGINQGYPTTFGAGGDCSGAATPNKNAGTYGASFPGYAVTNSGSGGGGGGYDNAGGDPMGGMGASGVIILRYPLNMSVSISFSGGTSATYRTVGTITATGTIAGKVTFYERGKAIPGCKSVAMNGSFAATCSWRPSTHGATVITATAKPSNTYVSNGSATTNISVVKRTNNR